MNLLYTMTAEKAAGISRRPFQMQGKFRILLIYIYRIGSLYMVHVSGSDSCLIHRVHASCGFHFGLALYVVVSEDLTVMIHFLIAYVGTNASL